MKKRRTLIVSLLLVAAMVMGIGYAALSSTLVINGTASLSNGIGGGGEEPDPTDPEVPTENDFLIFFKNASVKEANLIDVTTGSAAVTTSNLGTIGTAGVGATGTAATGSSAYANYHISGLKQEGEYVVFQYTVTNSSSDVTAYLRNVVVTNGTVKAGETPLEYADFFTEPTVKITATGADDEGVNGVITKSISIAPGASATVTVKVALECTIGYDGNGEISLSGAGIQLVFASEAP